MHTQRNSLLNNEVASRSPEFTAQGRDSLSISKLLYAIQNNINTINF